MSHVSIIGGGNMGQAIATIVTKGGHTVEVFNSNDADKPVTGEVVFLAVRYPAVANVLAQRGDQLAGKVVVGITKNPLNFETFDSLVVPADTSAAAEIASSLPQAGSPSSPDGMPGCHRAPDEGPCRWWYLGMVVLVLTLFALLTLLHWA
jgi:predicted dinucleotide-binding enzyme